MNNIFGKAAKNATITLILQAMSLLFSFLSRTVFIKLLTVEYLGVSGLFSNILTILSFAELGIGNVMIYSLYAPVKQQNNGRIVSLLKLYKKAYIIISSIILFIGIALTPAVPYLVKKVPDVKEDIRFLFVLFLLNTYVSYWFSYKKALLQADQKSYIITLFSNIGHIVLFCAQVAVLYCFHSYTLYLICQIVSTLAINVVLSIIVNHSYKETLKAVPDDLDRSFIKELAKKVKSLAISRVSGIVSNGVDNIIISRFFGLSSVGFVSNYTLITSSVNGLFFPVLTSLSSGIGKANVDNSVENKRSIFREISISVYFIYSFITTCIFVLAHPFIVQWIGESYLISTWSLLHLSIGIFVAGINYPVYSYRTTSGYFKEAQNAYVMCALSNLILSLIFAKIYGIPGVFMATWISKLIPEFWDSRVTYEKILNLPHWHYYIRYLQYFVLQAANTGICWIVTAQIPAGSWLMIIIKALVCGLINIIINYIVLAHLPEVKSVISRSINLVKARR